ncbi:hypothetical protein Lalb_Chr07g0177251 [Lupinus albus]|uniref:Uncharacterized protein n=1 Tax=Lupinus albus TaxID=3870 RepID=A0A6A4Q7F4_LUPAL|nr:hypothetical protein Lalb_Chr07g0177251 [Lupinus albus]
MFMFTKFYNEMKYFWILMLMEGKLRRFLYCSWYLQDGAYFEEDNSSVGLAVKDEVIIDDAFILFLFLKAHGPQWWLRMCGFGCCFPHSRRKVLCR